MRSPRLLYVFKEKVKRQLGLLFSYTIPRSCLVPQHLAEPSHVKDKGTHHSGSIISLLLSTRRSYCATSIQAVFAPISLISNVRNSSSADSSNMGSNPKRRFRRSNFHPCINRKPLVNPDTDLMRHPLNIKSSVFRFGIFLPEINTASPRNRLAF